MTPRMALLLAVAAGGALALARRKEADAPTATASPGSPPPLTPAPQATPSAPPYTAAPSAPPAPPQQGRVHVVQKGESLSLLAKRYYGDMMQYMTIFNANRDQLTDPKRIEPGQVLRIP